MFAVQRAVTSVALRQVVASPAVQRFAMAAAAHCVARAMPAMRVARMSSASTPKEQFVRIPSALTFDHDDQKELRTLLVKLHRQANLFDRLGMQEEIAEDRKGLAEIPGLELSAEQIRELVDWKYDLF